MCSAVACKSGTRPVSPNFICIFWLASSLTNIFADTLKYRGQGASTNGIYASIKYEHDSYFRDSSDLVKTFYFFSPPSTNIPFMSPFYTEPFYSAVYFLGTNSFSGLVELTDSTGKKIPLLNSNFNSAAVYPNQYCLSQAYHDLNSSLSMGASLPVGITGTGLRYGRPFNLPEIFKIEKSGDYQFTLWPIIYKRSETNRDIVCRIDIPPVTIPIKWTSGTTN